MGKGHLSKHLHENSKKHVSIEHPPPIDRLFSQLQTSLEGSTLYSETYAVVFDNLYSETYIRKLMQLYSETYIRELIQLYSGTYIRETNAVVFGNL